jgi:hypothetical protein
MCFAYLTLSQLLMKKKVKDNEKVKGKEAI